MINTLGLNLLQLLITFPVPVIFAILLNELKLPRFKKTVQTVTYFPYFISWVVFGGIILGMLSAEGGVINKLLQNLHIIKEPIAFNSNPNYFGQLLLLAL